MFSFTHYDLGQLDVGKVVEVSLDGTAANVRLMDSLNFSAYRAGQRHQYFGGHLTRSLARLPVPSAGHWHVAIDLGGYGGSVRSGVRVHRTLRWRKTDSNFQFPATVSFVKPRYHLLFAGTGADITSSATAFARRGIAPNRGGVVGGFDRAA
jgi:hypothetical protein